MTTDYDRMYLKTRITSGRQAIVEHALLDKQCIEETGLLDTGCRPNLIAYQTLKRTGRHSPTIHPAPEMKMSGAAENGNELNVLGYVNLNISFSGTKEYFVKFYVIQNLAHAVLLGREMLEPQ